MFAKNPFLQPDRNFEFFVDFSFEVGDLEIQRLLNYMDGPQIFGSVRSIDYSIVWMDHEIFEN